jgi:hypothetical protein
MRDTSRALRDFVDKWASRGAVFVIHGATKPVVYEYRVGPRCYREKLLRKDHDLLCFQLGWWDTLDP